MQGNEELIASLEARVKQLVHAITTMAFKDKATSIAFSKMGKKKIASLFKERSEFAIDAITPQENQE